MEVSQSNLHYDTNLMHIILQEFFYNSIHPLPSSLFWTRVLFYNFGNLFTLCFHTCSRSKLHKHSQITVGVCACIYFFSTISSKHEFNMPPWLPFQVFHCARLLYHFMNRILVGTESCSFRYPSMLCSLTTSLT